MARAGGASTVTGTGAVGSAAMGLAAAAHAAALSPFERLVAELPEAQQRRHEEFIQDPRTHVLLIDELGNLGPIGRGGMRGPDAWAGAKLELLAQGGCKVTHLARGRQSGIEIYGGVRRIDVADVMHYGWFSAASNLVEVARQLTLLTKEEARRTAVAPWNYYRWHDAYGTDGAFLARLYELHLKVEQHDRFLRFHFEPFLPPGRVLGESELTAHFDDDLEKVNERLGRAAADRWREETRGTFHDENALTRFKEWAGEALRWPELQKMIFSREMEGHIPDAAFFQRLGAALYLAEVQPGFEPESIFPEVGRTVFTPIESDAQAGALRDEDGLGVKRASWEIVQRMLLSNRGLEPQDRRTRRAARMFRGMGERFPEMKPVRAIASRDPLVLDWATKSGLSWSVKKIDYDAVGLDGRRYRDLVEKILAGGAAVHEAEKQGQALPGS